MIKKYILSFWTSTEFIVYLFNTLHKDTYLDTQKLFLYLLQQ